MVHISKLPMATRMADAREALIKQVESGQLRITIDDKPQDAEFLQRIRPFALRILNERISELETDLRAIGVDVS